MPVNGNRLVDRINRLAQIGRTPHGGVTRVSWTDTYWEAEAVVRRWMEEAGQQVHRDAAGNLIGRREGWAPGGPAILLGSHFDSVIDGGRFDGVAGVLSAIEVAQALREDGVQLNHALETVAFIEEEGSRFGSGIHGSRAMLGELGPEVHQRRDRDGQTFDDVMRQSGLDPARLEEAVRDSGQIAAYLELHIEQGAVLESIGQPVGVVTGIVGFLFLGLTLKGRADHAGATPMHLRADALAGAAELVLLTERLARHHGPTAVGTVGRLEVKPGQSNSIPGEVALTFDLRDIKVDTLNALESNIRREIERVARERDLGVSLQELLRASPVEMHPVVTQGIADACEQVGLPVFRLPSGAGHDAQVIARYAPAGMIFVRCRQGISHSPEEQASPEDLEAGANVLHRATLALDRRL